MNQRGKYVQEQLPRTESRRMNPPIRKQSSPSLTFWMVASPLLKIDAASTGTAARSLAKMKCQLNRSMQHHLIS
jgi:hypothetical protein